MLGGIAGGIPRGVGFHCRARPTRKGLPGYVILVNNGVVRSGALELFRAGLDALDPGRPARGDEDPDAVHRLRRDDEELARVAAELAAPKSTTPDLLEGPKRPGVAISQDDIDKLFG